MLFAQHHSDLFRTACKLLSLHPHGQLTFVDTTDGKRVRTCLLPTFTIKGRVG